jgi:NAD(P)-dependent dehydrogenase (short-subunit alcohol dehydrogenase family)
MTPSVEGQVALITGGSRGLGLGIAKALAAEGWQLAVNGMRPEEDVSDVLSELRDFGVETIYCRGDVSQPDVRQEIVQQVRAHFNRLHLLVNNAGITSPGRRDLLEATEEAFDRVFDVNLKGPYFLSQLAARWMIQQRELDNDYLGTIVNISSVSADIVSLNRGDYCMARSAMTAMTKLWAARLAEHAIHVYEIRPGVIRTDMTAEVADKYDRLFSEGLAAERRWGEPQDVGCAVAVLARRELSYCTGNVLMVDGGMSRLRQL